MTTKGDRPLRESGKAAGGGDSVPGRGVTCFPGFLETCRRGEDYAFWRGRASALSHITDVHTEVAGSIIRLFP